MTSRPSLPILTSLRFFAAAEVVAFHVTTSPAGAAIPEGLVRSLSSGGYAAVAFFFILSGFILTYAHAGATERDGPNVDTTRFWRLRLARIAPAYYLGLLLALPFLVQFVHHGGWPGGALVAGPLMVLLFLQAWWPPFATLWNYPAWSLSVEWLFYALFPWLVRILARLPRWALLVASYGLIVAATAYRADFQSMPSAIPAGRPDLLFEAYFPPLHLPLFVFGMGLGRLFLFGPPVSPRAHTALLALGAAALLLIFGCSRMLPWWTRSDAALAPLFAALVFGGARAEGLAAPLARPGFVLLGEASYAIYVLHVPLLLMWDNALGALTLDLPYGLGCAVYFAVVCVVSIGVLRYLETPMRSWIAGRRTKTAAA